MDTSVWNSIFFMLMAAAGTLAGGFYAPLLVFVPWLWLLVLSDCVRKDKAGKLLCFAGAFLLVVSGWTAFHFARADADFGQGGLGLRGVFEIVGTLCTDRSRLSPVDANHVTDVTGGWPYAAFAIVCAIGLLLCLVLQIVRRRRPDSFHVRRFLTRKFNLAYLLKKLPVHNLISTIPAVYAPGGFCAFFFLPVAVALGGWTQPALTSVIYRILFILAIAGTLIALLLTVLMMISQDERKQEIHDHEYSSDMPHDYENADIYPNDHEFEQGQLQDEDHEKTQLQDEDHEKTHLQDEVQEEGQQQDDDQEEGQLQDPEFENDREEWPADQPDDTAADHLEYTGANEEEFPEADEESLVSDSGIPEEEYAAHEEEYEEPEHAQEFDEPEGITVQEYDPEDMATVHMEGTADVLQGWMAKVYRARAALREEAVRDREKSWTEREYLSTLEAGPELLDAVSVSEGEKEVHAVKKGFTERLGDIAEVIKISDEYLDHLDEDVQPEEREERRRRSDPPIGFLDDETGELPGARTSQQGWLDDDLTGELPAYRQEEDEQTGDLPAYRQEEDEQTGDRPAYRQEEGDPAGDLPAYRRRDDSQEQKKRRRQPQPEWVMEEDSFEDYGLKIEDLKNPRLPYEDRQRILAELPMEYTAPLDLTIDIDLTEDEP